MTMELVGEDDISPCKRYRRKKYSNNELLERLRKFEIEEGRPPKEEDFKNNPKYPGFNTYHKRFGSWNNALQMAELKLEKRFEKYTDKELLEHLMKFEREEGRSPEAKDFVNNPDYPGYSVYQLRFGSWNNALQMAELQTKKGGVQVYTDKELLEYLRRFGDEKRRPPTEEYFKNNPKCPSYNTYISRFGGWQKALKLVGLDTDSTIKKCILETTCQKGRLAEIYVLEHFVEKEAKDLSGENPLSPFDGICPKGETYDVKSSRLRDGRCWTFVIGNLYREDIEWFYLLGFNEDYSELQHAWRIPSFDFIDEDSITIGISNNCTCNVENMKEYEITEKFNDIHFRFLNDTSEEKKEK